MRVTPEQLHLIKTLRHRYFGDDAEFWLFGSRADDSQHGADIDVLLDIPERVQSRPAGGAVFG
ncbi:MAG: nucleotidyltransferase family protein [Sulfuriferula sp.]